MTDLKPCQECGSEDIGHGCWVGAMSSGCYCVCGNCGARGPGAPSQEQARAAWNEREEEADD